MSEMETAPFLLRWTHPAHYIVFQIDVNGFRFDDNDIFETIEEQNDGFNSFRFGEVSTVTETTEFSGFLGAPL